MLNKPSYETGSLQPKLRSGRSRKSFTHFRKGDSMYARTEYGQIYSILPIKIFKLEQV